MLKVYISADIEGVNNVVYPHQIDTSGGESYILTRKQQALELNCIVEALLEAGVSKITINDAHGSMDNLHITELNPKIELITGKPKAVSMLANLDNSYSCVFFTGYHAKAGSEKGILVHTFCPIFKQVRLNGKVIGEIELNAIYAGLMDIPIALVTGDDACCQEALDVLVNMETVSTKTAISTSSAKCKPNEELFSELRKAALNIINAPQKWALYKKDAPYELELEFVDRKYADLAELLPMVKRMSPATIGFKSDNYQEIYKLMQFLSATLSHLK